MLDKTKKTIVSFIWETHPEEAPPLKAFLIKFLRLIYATIRAFHEEQLTLRAMSLVYTTILSLVPLLAVSFSVLKAFGVHNRVEPILMNMMAPLGPEGQELVGTIIGFVENVRVGILGSIGMALLFYTAISLIQKIENALNQIWRIRKPRSFARRFSDYMSVLIIGPVFIFSAMGLTAAFMNNDLVQKVLAMEPLGTLYLKVAEWLPYLFVIAAFTFIYIFIPHTRVKLSAALAGGVFAGILWEFTGMAFASMVVTSTKNAIYSGFAILIFFMIWLYLNWLILLLGAVMAFYSQYPQYLTIRKEELLLSPRLKAKLALFIMYLIGDNFYHAKEPWSLDSMVERIGLPVSPVEDVLILLEKRGFLMEVGEGAPTYLPARAMETIHIGDVLSAVRVEEDSALLIEEKFLSAPQVDLVVQKIDQAIDQAVGNETLKDLVLPEAGSGGED